MTQEKMVLKMLGEGRTVSKLTAVHLNIGNVNEVIRRLRMNGWWICTRTDLDGQGRTFSHYELHDDFEKESAQRMFTNAA